MRPNRLPPSRKLRLPNVRAAGAIVQAWAKAALTPICATAARRSPLEKKDRIYRTVQNYEKMITPRAPVRSRSLGVSCHSGRRLAGASPDRSITSIIGAQRRCRYQIRPWMLGVGRSAGSNQTPSILPSSLAPYEVDSISLPPPLRARSDHKILDPATRRSRLQPPDYPPLVLPRERSQYRRSIWFLQEQQCLFHCPVVDRNGGGA